MEKRSDGKPAGTSRYHIEALAKGLEVLRLFSESATSLRLREICDQTGIPMPTAFRIVATLESSGYLYRLPDGSIQPDIAVLMLGSAALRGSSLVQASEQPIRLLAKELGETVNLGVLVQDEVLYLIRSKNKDLIAANIQVGSTLPAAYTSIGKLLLAYVPVDDIRRVFANYDFPKAGPNAIRSLSELESALEQVRKQGYAIQDEETAAGLRSVAVPVFSNGPLPIAGINVAVPTNRHDLELLRGRLLTRLQQTASNVSLHLSSK